MAAEQRVMVRCDAPHCDRVLEGDDGHLLFETLPEALDVAEVRNWLVTHSVRGGGGERKTYCPNHWHWQFGVKTPYWGARRRRYAR